MSCFGRGGVLYVEYNVNMSQSRFICQQFRAQCLHTFHINHLLAISWHSCLDTAAASPRQAPRAKPCTSQHNGPLMFPCHPVLSKQFKHDKYQPTKRFQSQFIIQIVFSPVIPLQITIDLLFSQMFFHWLCCLTVWGFRKDQDSSELIKTRELQIPDIFYAWYYCHRYSVFS